MTNESNQYYARDSCFALRRTPWYFYSLIDNRTNRWHNHYQFLQRDKSTSDERTPIVSDTWNPNTFKFPRRKGIPVHLIHRGLVLLNLLSSCVILSRAGAFVAASFQSAETRMKICIFSIKTHRRIEMLDCVFFFFFLRNSRTRFGRDNRKLGRNKMAWTKRC